MSKDPAFLFYHHDFLVGTDFMTAEEVGCYIRILCHMADKGRLSKQRMINVCRGYVITTSLEEKFKIDENGNYYNERLEFEVSKRKNFCESRRISRMSVLTSPHTSERMVNRNRNVNRSDKRTTKPTLEEVKLYCLERKSIVDPETFFHNYESTNWIKANGLPVKNWKSTVVMWEKRDKPKNKSEHTDNESRDMWEKKAIKSCTNCRGSGAVYAPGTGKYAKCGCVK